MQEVLDYFNQLSDRDIACYIYNRIFKCSITEISRQRNLTKDQVKYSFKKINNAENHDDIVAALQEVFSPSK